MGTYEAHRGGSGEPLVLIHGFSGTWRIWEPAIDRLEPSYDVLTVTLLGHVGGPECAPGASVSVSMLVDAVERDMDAAGFQTAHIVGNSLGGWIALELARRGRARSVVALAPAGGWEAGSRAEQRLRKLFARNHKLSTRLLPRIDKLMRRPAVRRMLLRQVATHGDRLSPAVAAQLVRDSVQCPIYFDLMDAIMRDGPPATFEGIECPVLFAWGTKDRIIPSKRYAQRLRELVPTGEWVELPGLGHVPMVDDPELVARTIREHTARAAERGAPAPA